VGDDGTLHVLRLVTAFDCGAVIDPANLAGLGTIFTSRALTSRHSTASSNRQGGGFQYVEVASITHRLTPCQTSQSRNSSPAVVVPDPRAYSRRRHRSAICSSQSTLFRSLSNTAGCRRRRQQQQ
jgi:hypothetical protein